MSHQTDAPTLDPVLHDIAGARHYNAWLFDRARPYLGARVLDAGAGVGTFVDLAAETGAEVVALEPEAAFADELRRKYRGSDRVTVVQAEAESLPEDVRGFDSILCFNVLEHINDDGRALAQFRDALRPGGRLLLLVPAHERLYGGFDRSVGHVRRYDRRRLGVLLTQQGFELDELRYVNPVAALAWFVSARVGRRGRWPSRSFRTFDRIIPIVRPLDALRLPFGLSVWAVARKPASRATGEAG